MGIETLYLVPTECMQVSFQSCGVIGMVVVPFLTSSQDLTQSVNK